MPPKKQSQRPSTTPPAPPAPSPPSNGPTSPTDDLPLDRPSPTDPLPFARPLPRGVKDSGHRYTLAQRIQCLTLLTEGFPAAHVKEKTGVSERSQRAYSKEGVRSLVLIQIRTHVFLKHIWSMEYARGGQKRLHRNRRTRFFL